MILTDVALPLIEQARGTLRGAPVALLLADAGARVVDLRFAAPAFGATVERLGIGSGTSLGEEEVGTNAVGTPVETRQSLLVRGPEHASPAFQALTCYGRPIIHPITRRLVGVVDLSTPLGDADRLIVPVADHLAGQIEDVLLHDASDAQRRLLAAFQQVVRRRDQRVVVVGHGMILSTPAALDMLSPSDYAALRSCADAGERSARITLASGLRVRIDCERVEGTSGVSLHLTLEKADRPAPRSTGSALMLVVGEQGSGRTTQARRLAGAEPAVIDCAEILAIGQQKWTGRLGWLEVSGRPILVENIQLLSEAMTMLVAARLRATRRTVVLISTPGDHLDREHAAIASLCGERHDLLPLRRRRHEIPRLAAELLAIESAGRARLTAEAMRILAAQPWSGNLTELHAVMRSLASRRRVGDVVPSDMPVSYRVPPPRSASPLRAAEREVILDAIGAAGGSKVAAARALGVSRSTLYNRLHALGIG